MVAADFSLRNTEMKTKIAVLGAGCWGTTLASLLSTKGERVSLWEIYQEQADKLKHTRKLDFLPQLTIPEQIEIDSDIKKVIEGKQIIVLAVPSHFVRDTMKKLAQTNLNYNQCIIVSATKGLETGQEGSTQPKRMSQIIEEELPQLKNPVSVLSGPSHAEEVSQKIPTAVVIAGTNSEVIKQLQKIFFTDYFRVYTHSDIAGVEIGGALKNIFAIAAGLSDGMGLGDNTKSALVTRGLRELVKLGEKLGGKTETFFGLSGLGDLIATCFSRHSRNRLLGEKIGGGEKPEKAQEEIVMVSEGYRTTKSAHILAKKHNMDLPIIHKLYSVLYENKSPKEAVYNLMLRQLKSETEGVNSC